MRVSSHARMRASTAVVDRLASLEAEAVDIADEVRRAAEGLEADLGATTQLEERLGDLYGLLRKYGETEEAAIEHAAAAAAEVERLEGSARNAPPGARRTNSCVPLPKRPPPS